MAQTTTNLGLVKAIFVGSNPPTNTDVIWKDTTAGLHKVYNISTSSWVPLINFVLVDNVTIKIDENGKIYVDTVTIPELSIANGSITMLKLANVNSGTVFYRKSAGSGPPESQTLAILKSDLGLIGTNSGDQDLTVLVPKTRKINNKALTGDITLTPEDIGSPTGSGNSTGENTGDETLESILAKLLITVLSGDNTGDQTALQVPIEDLAGIFLSENVEFALLEVKSIVDEHTEKLAILNPCVYKLLLSASSTVEGRIAGATITVGGVTVTGWSLSASGDDLTITHNLTGRTIANVTVKEIGTPNRMATPFEDAYSGITESGLAVTIEGLNTTNIALEVNLIFN